MTDALTQQTSQGTSRGRRRVSMTVGAIGVGLLAAGTVAAMYWGGLLGGQHELAGELATVSAPTDDDVNQDVSSVTMPAAKLTAAGINVELVRRQTLTHQHSVPGRVVYNDNRHIELTAPTAGILTEVLVKPGDHVRAGQVLAWLNSPEIGTARADVLQRKSDAELAAALLDRARTLEKNVVALVEALKGQPGFDALSKQCAGQMLGDYRKQLLASYSQMRLAESLVEGREGLSKSGVLSGKVMRERQNAARAARAELESACEQAELDVWKQRSVADSTAGDTQRRVEIARQRLAALLLDEAATRKDGNTPRAESLGASDKDLNHLSRVAIRAPLAGTIENRMVSTSERVSATDSMFTLADTSTMWITAEIRENDWPAVAIETGQSVSVTVPALDNSTFKAGVEYIGREVSPKTNAVPIVAGIDNSDGRLRAGLFVRVSVPVGVKADVLTAPTRAVLQHDGRSFVFVPAGDNRFRRVDVRTGDEDEERIEIVSGLNVGTEVVTSGAFILKSELLLEGEEE